MAGDSVRLAPRSLAPSPPKSSSSNGTTNTLPAMLSSLEKAVLDLERSWWRHPGAKDQTIEFVLGVSSAAYYEMLLGFLSRPAAFSYDPLTMRRIAAIVEPPLPAEEVV